MGEDKREEEIQEEEEEEELEEDEETRALKQKVSGCRSRARDTGRAR